MNHYPHHIGDYRSATAHLSNEEDLAYRRMIETYYDTETALTTDVPALARRLRVSIDAIQTVLNDFFTLAPHGWVHERCEVELDAYRERVEKASQAGKASAARRGNKPPLKPEQALNDRSTDVEQPLNTGSTTVEHSLNGSQLTINHKPLTINQEPKEEKAPRKRDATPSMPDGVEPAVWQDWLTLRAKKRAPVTTTVVTAAQAEAVKAGLTFTEFLRVWCIRGSQGLQAEWLRPNETGHRGTNGDGLTPYQREMAQRVHEATGGLASPRRAGTLPSADIFDMEVSHDSSKLLG